MEVNLMMKCAATVVLGLAAMLGADGILPLGGSMTVPVARAAAGGPEFKKSVQVFEAAATVDVTLVDVDRDKDVDVVISNYGRSLVLLNDGTGHFTESWRGPTVHGLAAGDIDGDGRVDLVVVPGYEKRCQIYLNNGRGTFHNADRDFGEDPQGDFYGLRLLDVDRDGDLDAVNSRQDGRSVVWLNDGRSRFTKGEHAVPSDGAFGDLNGDGFVDVLTRESEQQLVIDAGSPAASEAARRPSLRWVTRAGDRGFRVYLNDRQGRFTRFEFLPVAELVRGQYLWTWFADVDDDGDTDAIYTDGANRTLAAGVLLNDGAGRLSEGQKLAPVTMGKVCTGDLDSDGALDLVITNWGQPAQLWMNDGKGRFVDAGRVGDRFNSQGCAVGDVDKDGDQDLIISDYHQGNTSIWFNQLIENRKAPKR
jgi:hypothetical protein